MSRWPVVVAALVAAAAAAGCSLPAADARTAFVISALTADNQRWLDRDPAAVAGKYQRMASRRYDFFRGTAGLFWRDVTDGGAAATSASVADGPGAWVWTMGDAHLENLGSFRAADGALVLDYNDFDGATRGPWWLDLRRLAMGVAVASDELDLGDVEAALVERALAAYVDEIARLADGGPAVADGPWVTSFLAKSREAGDARARLDEYTAVDPAGVRTMVLGDLAPVAPDGTWVDTTAPLTADELADVTTLMADAGPTALASAGPVKGASRRLGAGVASYPSPRYYVLCDGPTAAADDDVLLEAKEATPPAGRPRPPAPFDARDSDAGQVVRGQRLMAARPDGELFLAAAEVGPRSFRVKERTGYQRGVELAKLAGDRDAVDEVVAAAGRLLADAHARAPLVDGRPALTVIAPRLAGRRAEVLAEFTALARDDAARVRADADRFAAALAERGPLLGVTP
ncbi:MAG: DUF2252 family protein [Kofleriaceae bacterium]